MSHLPSLAQQAHQRLKSILNLGDHVIDATCGNGHDSLFLAEQVAPLGRVYSFDLQKIAIEATEKRLQQADLATHVSLIHAGHETMDTHIPCSNHGRIKAIMFNLGYLPRSDKQIITLTATTLMALEKSILLLAPLGMITILAYPGHSGGNEETFQVTNWCQQLPKKFSVEIIESIQPKATAPQLFVIQKKLLTIT
ncbi:MAG: class I SAM-dependent methyltransferase [Methylococcales bacterium]|nr:class I SAM-dependent methyltransferase [Methylococcales bacterium]